MKFIFSCFFVMICLVTTGQSKDWKRFVLKGFTLLDSASGDLNNDGYRDLILILKNHTEVEMSDTTRPLLILHGSKNKTYTLIARNDHIVLCQACGGVMGDPYASLVVKHNYFSVEHYGGSNWRWTRIITFKYDLKTKQYVLHKDGGESFHTSDPDKTTNQFYGKQHYDKLPFIEYNYNTNL